MLFVIGFVTCFLLHLAYYYTYVRPHIYFLKHTDSQTQLFNFQYLHVILNQIMYDVYIIIIDVDDFKRFNSNYSYSKGDEIILMVRDAILLSSDKHKLQSFRYRSGDEFVIIAKFSMFSVENINIILDEIKQNLLELDETSLLTLSTGVTIKTSVTSVAESIKMLEESLLIAKTKKNSSYCKSLVYEGWINSNT